jgi:hypothetical protein
VTLVRAALFCVLFVITLSTPGCGGSTDVAKPPTDEIALLGNLVSQIPDASSRPQNLKALFAKDGTVPSEADRKRMQKLQFQVNGAPTMKDGTATAEVQVRNSSSPEAPGKAQWTFVKENDQWKLKTAPLP